MKDMRPTIVRLLSNMGSAREIQLYLKRFSQVDAIRFAVVKVTGAVLQDDLAALVSSLSFLQQVGLTPVVVHDAGSRLEQELDSAGIRKRMVHGQRYISANALAIVRRVIQLENLRLVEALQAEGVRATSILSGVFEARALGHRRYGMAGDVARVHTSGIEAAIAVRSIPVIAAIGESDTGQILCVSVDRATHQLVKRLEPYKIIFLAAAGGWLDQSGHVIDSVNLSTEYDTLIGQPWLTEDARAQIRLVHDLLMQLPPDSSLSITRPDEMAKELFTHRGSGTLVRRGERIRVHRSWARIDQARFRDLIESSFQRTLVRNYFESTQPLRIYCSERYRAAIVLTREGRLTWMDKFAVSEDAQGEGLGRAIWLVMRAEHPQLFWRSRRDNPINEFYFANSDGAFKDSQWTVFWYGLTDWNAIRFAVDHARTRRATLIG